MISWFAYIWRLLVGFASIITTISAIYGFIVFVIRIFKRFRKKYDSSTSKFPEKNSFRDRQKKIRFILTNSDFTSNFQRFGLFIFLSVFSILCTYGFFSIFGSSINNSELYKIPMIILILLINTLILGKFTKLDRLFENNILISLLITLYVLFIDFFCSLVGTFFIIAYSYGWTLEKLVQANPNLIPLLTGGAFVAISVIVVFITTFGVFGFIWFLFDKLY